MSESSCPSASSTENKTHHVAVYLTADSSSYQAVDAAYEQARSMGAEFSAFYIDTYGQKLSARQEEEALREITTYASTLGAHVDSVSGNDPVFLVAEYCKSHHVDFLVMNRPYTQRGIQRFIPTFAQRVSRQIPETKLMTVPGQMTIHFNHLEAERLDLPTAARELVRVLMIVAATTLLCVILDKLGADEFPMAQIVVIGVLLCSVNTSSWIWGLFAAALSVVLFIFLFAEPRYVLFYTQPRLTISFLMTFASSLIGGFIGTKLHHESLRAMRSSWGTQVLLDTTHALQRCETPLEIVSAVGRKLSNVTEKNVVYYPYRDEVLGEPLLFPVNPSKTVNREELDCELVAVRAAIRHQVPTGSKTQYYPEAAYMYFPWMNGSTIYGIIGIRLDQEATTPLELMILNSIVAEGVLSLDAKLKDEELQKMQIKAESDALRSNLLKALSHDVRTPLTSIIGNVAYIQAAEGLGPEEQKQIWKNIQDDSLNMYHMIENLLTSAKLDNNTIIIKPQPEILDDVVEAGLEFPSKANDSHPIDVEQSDELLMVYMDPSLIAQVISNMVLNAIHHTPEGTPITVRTFREGDEAVIEVADTGNGISDSMKDRIFDIFYTGEAPSYDSTHYLGLGLFLCKAIVQAHKGTISVRDNDPQGAVFSFRLPLMEIS